MSACPDCGRERVETMEAFWKNPSYSCPVDVPRTECNDDSYLDCICKQGQVERLRAALAKQTQRADNLAGIFGLKCSRIAELEDALAERDRRITELEAQLSGVRDELAWAIATKLLPQRPQDGDKEET